MYICIYTYTTNNNNYHHHHQPKAVLGPRFVARLLLRGIYPSIHLSVCLSVYQSMDTPYICVYTHIDIHNINLYIHPSIYLTMNR